MRALIVLIVALALAAGAWFLGLGPQDTGPEAGTAPAPAPAARGEPVTPAAAPSGTSAAPSAPAEVQAQAERYVATLTEPDPAPVRVERADHFVTGEQMLSLIPRAAVEETTIKRLREDASLDPDMPITVVREVEQVERMTPERLIAQSGGNLEAPIKVLDHEKVRDTTVRELLEQASRTPDKPIDVVTRSEYFEQTTARELAQRSAGNEDEPVRLIRKSHGLESSSVGDLMRTQDVSKDSLFYVRTVRPDDAQGIWGIVQSGIIENFARGMAIRRGKEINTYKVQIPKDADERRADASSSFLGRLIHEKTKASYVYNFNLSRMGRNPDRIFPGQEIVIIDFRADELIDIYKHFVSQRG